MTETTHYQTLGILPTATDAEIKRAWAREVRLHPPDRDQAGNQRINEAKQTLLDPRARSEYDAWLQHGEEIGDAMRRAEEATEAERHAEAAEAYLEILAIMPDAASIRNSYGLAQARAGDLSAAVRTLRELVRREPDVGLYWANLGQALAEQIGGSDGTDLSPALIALQRAEELEPSNADYLVAQARVLRRMELFADAERVIERALFTDGKLDVQDLDALFELPMIHLFADQTNRIVQDAERIMSVVADLDQGAKEYCAHRFARSAVELWEVHAYAPAQVFAKAARRFAPNDEDIVSLAEEATRRKKVDEEIDAIKDDSNVARPIKETMGCSGLHLLEYITTAQAQKMDHDAIAAIGALPARTIADSLQHCKTRYPALYSLAATAYDGWLAKALAHQGTGGRVIESPPEGGGCVLALIVPTAIAAAVLLTQWLRIGA